MHTHLPLHSASRRNRSRGYWPPVTVAATVLVLSLLAALLLPVTGTARAQAGVTASLEVRRGTVELLAGGPESATDPVSYAAGERILVAEADQIRVSEDGEALLTFFDGQESRLGAGAVVVVTTLAEDAAADTTEVELRVLLGQTFNSIERALDAGSRFDITTPAATVSVRGTEFVVVVRENDLMQVTTLTGGVVRVSAGETFLDIECGYGTKLLPGDLPENLIVWGMARYRFVSPVAVPDDVPVRWVNPETGQVFIYNSGDVMGLPLGPWDVTLDIPGPVRLENIVFPEDTVAGAIAPLPVSLAAVRLQPTGADGAALDLDEDGLFVRLQQGDLANSVTAAPGEPLLVGPGHWDVEIGLASDPTNVISLGADMLPGDDLTVPVDLSALVSGD